MSYLDAVDYIERNGFEEPDPADYGVWVPVPVEGGLGAVGCADWLKSLILAFIWLLFGPYKETTTLKENVVA